MDKDILVYIAGPIAPANGYTVEQNIARGIEYFMKFSRLGIPSFLPHMAAAFPKTSELAYNTLMEYDFRIIDRCTHIFMMPDWALSKGAVMEFNYALANGLPVLLYWDQVEELIKEINVRKSARPSRQQKHR